MKFGFLVILIEGIKVVIWVGSRFLKKGDKIYKKLSVEACKNVRDLLIYKLC